VVVVSDHLPTTRTQGTVFIHDPIAPATRRDTDLLS